MRRFVLAIILFLLVSPIGCSGNYIGNKDPTSFKTAVTSTKTPTPIPSSTTIATTPSPTIIPTTLSHPTLTPSITEEVHIFSISEVTALVKPAVVRIETESGSGSGFIINNNGYILTNNHVVDMDTLAKVTTEDGSSYDAVVIERNEIVDLAIIAMITNRTDFPVVVLSESENVNTGDEVIALGYALGLEGQVSVSKGIISAIRTVDGLKYIQTDAPLNEGNSGGPLVKMDTQVVGINTWKYVGEGIEGMNFAIPIDEANSLIKGVLKW